jgi:hypothetical protein
MDEEKQASEQREDERDQREDARDEREDERDERYEGAEEVRDDKYEGREDVRDTRYSIRETVRDEIQVSYRRFLKKALPVFLCAGMIVALVSGLALYDSQRIGDNQASAGQVRAAALASCKAMNELRSQSNESRMVLRVSLRALIVHLQQDVEGQTKPAVIQRLNNLEVLQGETAAITLTPPTDCASLYDR